MATIRLDGTNILVFGGVLLIAAAGSWQFIGTYLLWAVWQVVLYYVVLAVVAGAIYGGLFLAVGGKQHAPSRERDRADEAAAE